MAVVEHEIPPNGNYVTWRELTLSLRPLWDLLNTVHTDVKTLVSEHDRRVGAEQVSQHVRARRAGERERRFDARNLWITVACTMVGVIATLLVTLYVNGKL